MIITCYRMWCCIQERFVIKFTGRAWNLPLFIRGGDDIAATIESLAAVPLRNEGTYCHVTLLLYTHF